MKAPRLAGWKIGVMLLASFALGFNPLYGSSLSKSNTQTPGITAPSQAGRQVQPGPGTLNYIEGQVTLNGQFVSRDSIRNLELKPGQVLDTSEGYAEVLLTPGAYLRVGHNSQVRLVTAGLAAARMQLLQGTALIEVDDLIKGTSLAVEMDGTTTQIEKKGLYDFDADQQAVRVFDGKAKIIQANRSTTLEKGDEVLLTSKHPLKRHEFNIKEAKNEPLYVWSAARSEQEAEANASEANVIAANGGWYGPGWYWNPWWDFYAWLPPYDYLYSPFGWGFYSPFYFGCYYAVPFYRGYYHGHPYRFWHGGHVGGFAGGIHGGLRGGFSNGFHGGMPGGFHGGMMGGFHGGARR